MQAIGFYLIYPFLWLLSRLPFPVLYFISDVMSGFLFHVVKYRRDVIEKNLKIAFPNLSQEKYEKIARENLRHFCDIFIEMIKSLSLSKEEMRRRFTCDNVDEMNSFAQSGKSVIIMLGHQASYEWIMVLSDQLIQNGYAVYKPLKNKYFDRLIQNIRRKFGTTLVAMRDVRNLIERVKAEPSFFGFIADQAPKPSRAKYFTQFFNRPTAVFMGAENLAKKHDMQVVYLRVKKIKRGFYHSEFELITSEAKKEKDWYVTDRFIELLENDIAQQPNYYLWSHKRWKSTLENTTGSVTLSPLIQQ